MGVSAPSLHRESTDSDIYYGEASHCQVVDSTYIHLPAGQYMYHFYPCRGQLRIDAKLVQRLGVTTNQSELLNRGWVLQRFHAPPTLFETLTYVCVYLHVSIAIYLAPAVATMSKRMCYNATFKMCYNATFKL